MKIKKKFENFELILLVCLAIFAKLGLLNNLSADNFKWIFLFLTDYLLISLLWPFLKNKFIKKINIFLISAILILSSLLVYFGNYANSTESLSFFGLIMFSFFFVSKMMKMVLLVILPILAIIGGFQSFYSFNYLFFIVITNIILFLPPVLVLIKIISKIGRSKLKKDKLFIDFFLVFSFIFYIKVADFSFLIIFLKLIFSPGFLVTDYWFNFLDNGNKLFILNWGIPLQIIYFYTWFLFLKKLKKIKIKTDKQR